MSTGRLTSFLITSVLAAGAAWPGGAAADDAQNASASQQNHRWSPNHHKDPGEFIRLVRNATWRFRDVSVAIAEGYVEQFGCVSGSDEGAMGVHFVNGALVGDPALDPARPELLIYEAQPNGKMKLIGADYLVLADAWHAQNTAPPELLGQLFHLFEAPNRFGLPSFYTLHIWAWKENPHGAFVNWHPNVSCQHFNE
jgi:hypothetical protein